MLAFSATFPQSLLQILRSYMRQPKYVNITAEQGGKVTLEGGVLPMQTFPQHPWSLSMNGRDAYLWTCMNWWCALGVRLYYVSYQPEQTQAMEFSRKGHILAEILSRVSFHQCMVFCNQRGRSPASLLRVCCCYCYLHV